MINISVEELPQKLDSLINQIENGESCLIVKKGHPIAEILPIKKSTQGWKRTVNEISLLNGVSAQSYIENERSL